MNQAEEKKQDKKLFLLDAYALIFRAYYAFIRNPRFNSKGLNTSAVFGFTNTLEELLRKEQPTHIAVVFDPPSPTFRHEMYKEYKANREETPEDIKRSVPYIKDLIEAFKIQSVEVMGYEADDVIGTLAKKAENQGFTVYMVTPDKDFAQLITDRIFMYKPRKGGNDVEIWGPGQVRENFHVEYPAQVIDILALWGDTADNIPGAPGIGEKTSKRLIQEYGSVENLLKHTEDLKGKQKENIEEYQEQIKLSRELVTIDLDAPIEFNEKDFRVEKPDIMKLQELFNELEFKTIARRILERDGTTEGQAEPVQTSLFEEQDTQVKGLGTYFNTIKTIDHNYILADTEAKIKQLVTGLDNITELCFDTETTGLNAITAELVGIAFSFNQHEAYYIPVPEHGSEAQKLLERFKPVLENPGILKIGQNIKYDIQILRNYGIYVQGALFDTMMAHYLLQPDLRHNLSYLAESYLNYSPVEIEELIGERGKNQKNMRDVPLKIISDYACEDADLTWQLKGILHDELDKQGLLKLAEEIEMPLIYVLADMERSGVRLDIDVLKRYGEVLKKEIVELENKICHLAGTQFNIGSPKQLGEILFERLKIVDKAKKTKTKQYSTSEDVLIRIRDKHEIIPNVLEYRSLKKLLSTYVEVLPGLVNPETKRIHTSFNQAVAATGRLSSNNPNLQNIPIREERGREIRKAFIPSTDNHVLFSADYSQIELRLMAHMSGDKNMIEAFRSGEDIHSATAAKIQDIPIDRITADMRSKAKTANFGIIYGISSFGLAQRLNISRKEASDLIQGYFKTYPDVKEYMIRSIGQAREHGYVQTIMGRRRYLPDIHSRNAVVRGMAERNAINAPIQGSAADIIKAAMIGIQNRIKRKNLRAIMILQVHDELIFDAPREELEELKELVLTGMETAASLEVPLTVEWGVGMNWLEAH